MKHFLSILLAIIGHISLFGQNIDSFTLPNTVTNTDFSLSTYENEKAIVLIFYSGKCAYGEYYLNRINSLINEYSSQGVQFVMINSNNSSFVKEESISAMNNFAKQNSLGIPYLADKDKIAKNLLRASRTPEVFVLIPKHEKFNVVYKGAIDDSPQSASDVNHSYLRESLVLLLKNNPIPVQQTRPVGCLIK